MTVIGFLLVKNARDTGQHLFIDCMIECNAYALKVTIPIICLLLGLGGGTGVLLGASPLAPCG